VTAKGINYSLCTLSDNNNLVGPYCHKWLAFQVLIDLGFLHQKGFEVHQEELLPATLWQPLQEGSSSSIEAWWVESSHSGIN
jgi:hypothetical protein